MEQCPHITYDKTKIIFPSEDETNEKLKEKNDRWDCTEFDRDEIVCVEGKKFLRWIGCPRPLEDLTPWCLLEKRSICCCHCAYCAFLPVNVRCDYDSFFYDNEQEILLRNNRYDDYLQNKISKLDIKVEENCYEMEGEGGGGGMEE